MSELAELRSKVTAVLQAAASDRSRAEGFIRDFKADREALKVLLTNLTNDINNHEERLDTLTQRGLELEARVATLEQAVQNLQVAGQALNTKVNNLTTRVEALEEGT